MAPMGLGPVEVLLLLVMGTGLGLPLGIPPQAEDPVMAKIAPADCLAYLSLAGVAEPNRQSTNGTERILAEAEVRRFVAELKKLAQQAVMSSGPAEARAPGGPNEKLWQLLELLLTEPTALYVAEFAPDPVASRIRAGLVVKAGPKAPQIEAAVQALLAMTSAGAPVEVTVGGVRMRQIPAGQDGRPELTWGTHNGYFLVAAGPGEAERLQQRMLGAPPNWLQGLKRRLAVERPGMTAYVNLATILNRVKSSAPVPQIPTAIDALGLSGLSVWGAVSGFDGAGFTSHVYLGMNGEPQGLLAALDQPPLTKADLNPIPVDALAAYVARLNLLAIFDKCLEIAGRVDPNAATEMREGLSRAETVAGFKIRDEALASLGTTWRAFVLEGAGSPFPTFVVSVEVRDRQKLAAVFDKLIAQGQQALARFPQGAKLAEKMIAGRKAYVVQLPPNAPPIRPAICLDEKQLVVASSEQALEKYLGQPPARSLANLPEVAALLAGDAKPLMITYQDTKRVLPGTYSQIVAILPTIVAAQGGKAPFDLSLLPTVGSFQNHLGPSTSVASRSQRGWEFQSRQTIPGLNMGPGTPVAIALLLPAVQAAREAARRTQAANNLKMIGLALHNFHDSNRVFPAAYNATKDGKPLLSWRVHILPYIEAQALYQEFHLDEPWDSAHNKKLLARMPAVYRSSGSNAGASKTNYLGVRGSNALFVPPKEMLGKSLLVGTKFADVTDGTSNTIMVIEVPDAKAVEWTKPEDWEPNLAQPLEGVTGFRPGGIQVLFVDGTVRFLPTTLGPKTFEFLITRNGGEKVNLP